ncbi:MAG: hypothetical protein MJZ30_02680 [Paludibacteraceae bacterium]|nr:hypothetical protein [Paludibacteraceae bacterium]
MKKYFLFLVSALFALVSLTNCKYDNDDLENNCWKITHYETLLLSLEDEDLVDKYIYFSEGSIYFGEEWGSGWDITRVEYSLDGKKIVSKGGDSYKLTKGGDLMTVKLGTGVRAEYDKATIPAGMLKAIELKNYSESDYFEFGGTLDLTVE